MTSLLLYHRGMLADQVRTDSLRRAIEETVRPGDVVVDLGAGTGILAMFAARAGAARVYAIEQGPIVRLAEELVASNQLNHRVKLVHGESYEVELPERADVLITETLWNFGLGEGVLGFIADARAGFLNPDARVIPMTLALYAAPVQMSRLWDEIAWPAEQGGVDLTAARPYALNNLYQTDAQPGALLAAAEMLTSVNLAKADRRDVCGTAEFVSRAGTLHGLLGFFRATLSPSLTVTNGPPKRTSSWGHTFLPLERPLEIADGQRIAVRVETAANGASGGGVRTLTERWSLISPPCGDSLSTSLRSNVATADLFTYLVSGAVRRQLQDPARPPLRRSRREPSAMTCRRRGGDREPTAPATLWPARERLDRRRQTRPGVRDLDPGPIDLNRTTAANPDTDGATASLG